MLSMYKWQQTKVMVEGLKQIREVIADTDRQIQDRCMEFPEYDCLLSIPGFGPDVSSKVLGAVGDPFRFQSGKQVLKMAGWDLNAERSGKSSDLARPVISKKGKADLRYDISLESQNYLIKYFSLDRGEYRMSLSYRLVWDRMKPLMDRWLPPARVCHPYPLVRLGVIT